MLLQGISKRLFPGCVKSGEKVAFCLPSAVRKTQIFHHIISQPGKSLLEIPCKTYRERPQRMHVLKVVHSPHRPLVAPFDAAPRLPNTGPPPNIPRPRPPKSCASAERTAQDARRKRRGSRVARILILGPRK